MKDFTAQTDTYIRQLVVVPLLQHLGLNLNSKCEFNCDNIMILDRCNNDYKLRFMKSIYLKFEKQTLKTQERSIPLCVV